MKRGVTIDPTGRRVLIAEDFSCFTADFGDPNAIQDWYTAPLTADPWGANAWEREYTDPSVNPFSIIPNPAGGNMLQLTARQNPAGSGQWVSGMLNSVSADGSKGLLIPPYFYVEATIQFPDALSGLPVEGAEPAFWLNTVVPQGFADPRGTLEIDIIEDANDNSVIWQSSVHNWGIPNPTDTYCTPRVPQNFEMAHPFTIGVGSELDEIVFYLNRKSYFHTPRPNVYPLSFALMIGLAVGGQGFPPPPTTQGPITMNILGINGWQ